MTAADVTLEGLIRAVVVLGGGVVWAAVAAVTLAVAGFVCMIVSAGRDDDR